MQAAGDPKMKTIEIMRPRLAQMHRLGDIVQPGVDCAGGFPDRLQTTQPKCLQSPVKGQNNQQQQR